MQTDIRHCICLQYVAFNLGNEINVVSRPLDVGSLQGPQDIYEMRLNKVTALRGHRFSCYCSVFGAV